MRRRRETAPPHFKSAWLPHNPLRWNELLIAAPFLGQGHTIDFAPDIDTCVVENNRLKLPLCSDDFPSYRLEHLSNGCDILVARAAEKAFVFGHVKASREIDLARLIID